jgi:hypothetical protein
MTATPDERCGTYAGVQRHRRRREPACNECREAKRQYMRDFRARKGPANDRWWISTRRAALQLLAEEYPERFGELLTEVRKSGPTPWDPDDAL